MKIKFNYLTLSFLLVSLLAACGTNKKSSEQEQAANSTIQGDITRPPVFIKRGDLNSETNPEETISAEQWEKERKEAQ